ncbi:MAG: hypothetical protein AB7F94_05880 [Nitrospira sp.]
MALQGGDKAVESQVQRGLHDLVLGKFVAIKNLWTAACTRLSMSKRRLQHAGADSIQIQRYVGCAGFIPATESFPQFIAL